MTPLLHLRRDAFRLGLALVLGLAAASASAQSGDDAARKAARRAQLQMQNLQQEAQQAQAAKTKAESDKAAADKQLAEQGQQMSKLKSALPQAQKKLKEVETERDALSARVAVLEKQVADQKAVAEVQATLTGRHQVAAAEWQKEVVRRYDAQVTQVRECSVKNDKLVRLNGELVDRYRRKGVGEALKQADPLFGLSEVEVYNQMQDVRDRADAERVGPVAAPVPLPAMPELKLPAGATTEGKTTP